MLQDAQQPLQGVLVKVGIDFEQVATLEVETKGRSSKAQRLPMRQGHFNQGKLGYGSAARPLFADPVGQAMVGEMVPAAIFPAR